MVCDGDRAAVGNIVSLYEGGGIEGGDIEGGSECYSSRLEYCSSRLRNVWQRSDDRRGGTEAAARQLQLAVTAKHHERRSLVAQRKSQRYSAEAGAAERYGNRTR